MSKLEYNKPEAIKASKEFLKKVIKLQEEYGVSFNSDTGDVYLTYKSSEEDRHWDTIEIGWKGDGSPIKVTEKLKDKEFYKQQALSKLSDEELSALGLK